MVDKHNPLSNPSNQRPTTRLVHEGQARSVYGETSEALYLTSGYVVENSAQIEARFAGEDPDGYIYARFSNPTVNILQDRAKALEGAEACRALSSGMAAVTACFLAQLSAGDHVIAAKALFGSCRYVIETLLPRWGINSSLVDGTDLNAWANAIQPNTKLFFLESPTNPVLSLVDIQAVADLAHAHNILVAVDNVFATPLYQRPLAFGADLVIYSATKHIDGQGRCLGGLILGSESIIGDQIHQYIRQTGPSMSPFNAWVMTKGFETLGLRVDQQTDNATQIAEFLAHHKKVKKLIYPGHKDHPQYDLAQKQMARGSTLVAFELQNKAEAFACADALALIRISNNLGDTKSLIAHPSTTTHYRMSEDERLELGITQGLLRLSCGIEDGDDLVADLDYALSRL